MPPGSAKFECSIDKESLRAALLFLRLMTACRPLRGVRESILTSYMLYKQALLYPGELATQERNEEVI